MFESVLIKPRTHRDSVAGFALSLFIAALLVLGTSFLAARKSETKVNDIDLTLFTSLPAPPPPPPPAGGGAERAVEKKPVPRKRDIVVEPKHDVAEKPVPDEAPAEPSHEAAGEPGGVPGGLPGGIVGGVAGGVVGGVPGGTGTSVLPFGLGMTRPQQIAGAPPAYSREAMAARVEGKVLVRCIIAVEGVVRDCKIVKGVPMLSELVLAALAQSRFTPVTYQGRPESVQYLFTFNFKLP
jgi:protein TonB